MLIESAASFLDALCQARVLDANQLSELAQSVARFPDARALARELLQRDWLTAYQINQLFQGKGNELILGQYLILERIGEGGMGQVFKARQQRMNRLVALKVIRKDRLASPETVRRFRREVLAAAQLSHPNVVTAYDADQVGNVHLLAMEFVEGADLSRLVREYGRLPVPLACNYILQAAQGLQHAHEKGLVHRDIKPSNLLVSWGASRTAKTGGGTAATGRPVVKVLDLGLARLNDTEDGATSELTQEGAVMGTVDYLAPEQALNSRAADIRSDLYSLGCTFYFLLTGQVPYPGGTATEKLLKHRLDEPVPIEQLRPDVPTALANVVRKLMAKLPEERFQTPAELIEVLSAPLPAVAVPSVANGAAATGIRPAAPVAMLVTNFTGTPAAVAVPVTRVEEETQTSALLRKFIQRRRLFLDRKGLIALAGAGAVLLLLVLAAVLWPRSAKQRAAPIGPMPPPGQASTADLQRLRGRLATINADQARRFLLAVQRAQPGKAPAIQAAELLTLLPSPFDALSLERVAAADRAVAGSPEGLVAVLGDQRLRHWGGLPGFSQANCVDFSPDGKTLVSGGVDGWLRLWDTDTGRQQRAIRCEGRIMRVQFLPRGKRILAVEDATRWKWFDVASGTAAPALPGFFRALSPDGSALLTSEGNQDHVWDTATGRAVASFRAPANGGTQTAAFSADGRLVASWGAEPVILVREAATGKVRATLRSATLGQVSGLQFAAAGKILLSGDNSNQGTVRLWDVVNEKERTAFPNVMGPWAIAPDGNALVTVGRNAVAQLSSGSTGQELGRLPSGAWSRTVAFSPDSRLLATAGIGPDSVKLWDAATGKPVAMLPGNHPGEATSLKFTADGKALAVSRVDGRIDLWDVPSGTARLPDRPNPCTSLRLSHDGATLALLVDSTIQLVSSAGVKERRRLSEHRGEITGMRFSPDDLTLATASFDGTAKLWDVASGQIQATLSHHPYGVRYIAFTPDGKTVVSVDSHQVRFWETASGQPQKSLKMRRENGLMSAALSPDGRQLAAGSDNRGTVFLWDVPAGTERPSLAPFKERVWGLDWSPDGRALAVWSDFQAMTKLWDVGGNKELFSVPRSQTWSFSPDSRTIALASGEGQLRLYDVATGQVSLPLEGHDRWISTVVHSADGRFVVSADVGGRVIVWEPAARRRKLQMWQLPGAVKRVFLAPDSRHVITLNSNGSIYVLRFAPPPR